MVAPQPRGILDPNTGRPVGSDDPFFTGINNELSDKGFIFTWAGTQYGSDFSLGCWF